MKSSERLARETGYVTKRHSGRLRVALLYPNSYETGMSNLGFQKVYHLLNRRDDVVCERAFLPSREEASAMRKKGAKLATLETGVPLKDFDVLAFSITFELDYANALQMLELGGVSVIPDKGRPLVMAGGVAVTMNPEVMAPFIDIALLGEAEGMLDPLVDRMIQAGTREPEEFAGLPGVYVTCGYEPSFNEEGRLSGMKAGRGFPEKVLRAWSSGSMTEPNTMSILTPDTVFGDMALVETGKGCGRHCRFCAAGYSYRPTRMVSGDALTKAVDEALEAKGKVGLLGSAVADHPMLRKILKRIIGKGGKFSISSMRLDTLDEDLLKLCWEGGIRTITAAPEAGSERMLRIINKRMALDAMVEAARLIGKTARFNLKLYFLIGLPWEREEDVHGISVLVKSMRDAMVGASKERGSAGAIHVGVNGFVPKPWTPFQWAPFAGVKTLKLRFRLLRDSLKREANIKLATSSAGLDFVQALLSMGDRRLGRLVELAAGADGDYTFSLKAFRGEAGNPSWIDNMVLLPRDIDVDLPWGCVDYGLKEGFLSEEYQRASKELVIKDCPPAGARCERCGTFTGVCVDYDGE